MAYSHHEWGYSAWKLPQKWGASHRGFAQSAMDDPNCMLEIKARKTTTQLVVFVCFFKKSFPVSMYRFPSNYTYNML